MPIASLLVQDYEDRTDPLDEHAGSLRDVVEFMLEQRGMKRSQLAPMMGGRARVSEFFSGRRRPTGDHLHVRPARGALLDRCILLGPSRRELKCLPRAVSARRHLDYARQLHALEVLK